MNVADLIKALDSLDGDIPVEIEIHCLDGTSRRSVDLDAMKWKRGRAGQHVVFIIEGVEPEPRKVKDHPQAE